MKEEEEEENKRMLKVEGVLSEGGNFIYLNDDKINEIDKIFVLF